MSFRTNELQEAAKAVLTTTKMILGAEARHSRVTVVGGLAVVQLTHYYRATKDVDLFLGGNLRPKQLKLELPRANRAFTTNLEAVNGVSYRSLTTKILTAIDFLDINVVCSLISKSCIRNNKNSKTAFEPQTRILDELKAEEMPRATRDDLISMKAFGASKRDELKKLLQDIADIRTILLKHPGPLLFAGSAAAEANKEFVKEFLPFLAQHSDWSEEQW
ncbi:hypothetical protein G7Y89_g7048 [Cudoniella acicularis]|uniref:Uncharacterized protein n=1 Tax=Cudoniella acicularis TaxID=354080 RepID=A0A8H4RKU2_9HELO|nr:hypothetical protein G7Y89_g7048 [Cudoniella acicularis]